MSRRILVMIIGITAFSNGLADDPMVSTEVAAEIERSIERGNVRAVAVDLYDSGEVRVTGFGQPSLGDKSVPTGDTLFEIGSITKVFTSLLAQTQVDTDRLSWDDNIGSRLPDLQFANAEVAAITLRELSTHSSGLPRLPDNMDPQDPMNPYLGYDRDLLFAFLAAFDPDDLVKLIVARDVLCAMRSNTLTGKSWQEHLEKKAKEEDLFQII